MNKKQKIKRDKQTLKRYEQKLRRRPKDHTIGAEVYTDTDRKSRALGLGECALQVMENLEKLQKEKLEEKRLPADIDYKSLRGLRIEAAQKLDKFRPMTVGQASRISGVNPADISVLLIYLGLK